MSDRAPGPHIFVDAHLVGKASVLTCNLHERSLRGTTVEMVRYKVAGMLGHSAAHVQLVTAPVDGTVLQDNQTLIEAQVTERSTVYATWTAEAPAARLRTDSVSVHGGAMADTVATPEAVPEAPAAEGSAAAATTAAKSPYDMPLTVVRFTDRKKTTIQNASGQRVGALKKHVLGQFFPDRPVDDFVLVDDDGMKLQDTATLRESRLQPRATVYLMLVSTADMATTVDTVRKLTADDASGGGGNEERLVASGAREEQRVVAPNPPLENLQGRFEKQTSNGFKYRDFYLKMGHFAWAGKKMYQQKSSISKNGPIQVWKADLVDSKYQPLEFSLRVHTAHGNWAKSEQRTFKFKNKQMKIKWMAEIKRHQEAAHWIEDLVRAREMAAQARKKAGDKSSAGWVHGVASFFGADFADYTSPAKVQFETVITGGFRFSDSTAMIDLIYQNHRRGDLSWVSKDIVQTCDAFKAHFDEFPEHCRQHLPFCLYFYQSMVTLMSFLQDAEHTNAAERVVLLQSFLLTELSLCSEHRDELYAAVSACDDDLLRELIKPAPPQNRLQLPFSEPKLVVPSKDGFVSKRLSLDTTNSWEMFFTMILLETLVGKKLHMADRLPLLRYGVFEYTVQQCQQQQYHQRQQVNMQVSLGDLGLVIARAARDGCFARAGFSLDDFNAIVTKIYLFPKLWKSDQEPGTKLSVNDVFTFAEKCAIPVRDMLGARGLQSEISCRNQINICNADFISDVLSSISAAIVQEPALPSGLFDTSIVCDYFSAFLKFHHLTIDMVIHGVYGRLDEILDCVNDPGIRTTISDSIADHVDGIAPAQMDQKLSFNRMVKLLKPLPQAAELARDPLVACIVEKFLRSRPNARQDHIHPRDIEKHTEQMIMFIRLLSDCKEFFTAGSALGIKDWLDLIVAKVAHDAMRFDGLHGNRKRSMGIMLTVARDESFGLISDETRQRFSDEAEVNLRQLVVKWNDSWTSAELQALLNSMAPEDARMGTVSSPVFQVWQSICRHFAGIYSQGDHANAIRMLERLADAGQAQLASSDHVSQVEKCTARKLCVAMFYSSVLLTPSLERAYIVGGEAIGQWEALLGVTSDLVGKAVWIGQKTCIAELPHTYQMPLQRAQATIAQLQSDVSDKNVSMTQLEAVNAALSDSKDRSASLKVVVGEELLVQVEGMIFEHRNCTENLEKLCAVLGWLSSLNVPGSAAALTEIRIELGRGDDAMLNQLKKCLEIYTSDFKRGLSPDMYDFLLHFQQHRCAIFDCTVRSLAIRQLVDGQCALADARKVLEDADQQLLELLAGTINTNKLVNLLPFLKTSNIPAEIDQLRTWKDYEQTPEDAAQKISGCMELLQKMANVESVLDTLTQYKMIRSDDPDAASLRENVNRFAAGGAGMSLSKVEKELQKMEVLHGLGPAHFKFMLAVREAPSLVRFLDKEHVDGKDYYSEEGSRKFRDRLRLVDTQIQSSASREHHGRLLNRFHIDAMPLVQCFATVRGEPLPDVVKAIATIPRIVEADQGGADIDSLCESIRIASDSISTLKAWFTRGQLSTFANAGSRMADLRQTGMVVIELRDLIGGDTSFTIKYKLEDSKSDETLSIDAVEQLQRQLTFSMQDADDNRADSEAALETLKLLRAIFDSLTMLQDSGHPFYQNRILTFFSDGDSIFPVGKRGFQTGVDDLASLQQYADELDVQLNQRFDKDGHPVGAVTWETQLTQQREHGEQPMLQMLSNREISTIVHLLSEQEWMDIDCAAQSIVETFLGPQSALNLEESILFCVASLLRPVQDFAICKCKLGLHSPATRSAVDTVRTRNCARGHHDLRQNAERAVEFTLHTIRELLDEVFILPSNLNQGDAGRQFALSMTDPLNVFAVLLQQVFPPPSKPSNTQILWGSEEISNRDVELFFQRVRSFRARNFVLCGVEQLTQSSRDAVYANQQQLDRSHARHANVFYVTLLSGTDSSIGSFASYIRPMVVEDVLREQLWPHKDEFESAPSVTCLLGSRGSGKTHKLYALLEDAKAAGHLTEVLSMVDNVDTRSVSRKLAALELRRGAAKASVFINVADIVEAHEPSTGHDNRGANRIKFGRKGFFYEVNRLLFEAIVLGYTRHHSSGARFVLPSVCHSKINVVLEVPAAHEGDAELAMMPVLQILDARRQWLDNDPQSEHFYPYHIGQDERAVATMLNALHQRWQAPGGETRVIDTGANEVSLARSPAAQKDEAFGVRVVLPSVDDDEVCRRLILEQLTLPHKIAELCHIDAPVRRVCVGPKATDIAEMSEVDYFGYMGNKIARSKLLQSCFLAYLRHRCQLYQSTFYQINQGIKLPDGRHWFLMGSSSAKQFIRESIELCDNGHDIDDRGEYLLLGNTKDCSLTVLRKTQDIKADDLKFLTSGSEKQIDEDIGTTEAHWAADPEAARGKLEERWAVYLGRGLGFGGNIEKQRKVVNKVLREMPGGGFVMVSDFCFKIIHIHERKLAQLPVIIEGETGVGKTFLLDCYARLLESQQPPSSIRMEPREPLLEQPPRQDIRVCAALRQLLDDVKQLINDELQALVAQGNADAINATTQFNRRRWQLVDETKSEPGTAREDIQPIDEAAMLEHFSWLCQVGRNPDAGPADQFGAAALALGADDPAPTWLSEQLAIQVSCTAVRRLSEHMDTWKQIHLLCPSEDMDRRCDELRAATADLGDPTQTPLQTVAMRPLLDLCQSALTAFLQSPRKPLFERLMVHPGITMANVEAFLKPLRDLAAQVPAIELVVFFDEVNTAPCQGLFKEILYDRCFAGEKLPRNLFFIAAINPDRAEVDPGDGHLVYLDGQKVQTVKTIHRDVYVVHKMQPALKALKWNYTKLDDSPGGCLERYINYKVSSFSVDGHEFRPATQTLLAHVITASQNFMITHLGESSVSQRDVQRCFKLIQFFHRHAPAAIRDEGPENLMQAAVALAASVAYFFRLPTERVLGLDDQPILLRDHYVAAMRKVYPQFLDRVTACIDTFVTRQHFEIPSGIALNKALKENLFCMVAALDTGIPVSIIGVPGSSKTLSFQVMQRNLRGSHSPMPFCRPVPEGEEPDFERTFWGFKEIEPFFYQCNEYSTETQIASVFDRAIERQRSYDAAAGKRGSEKRCVVFLDEASLPNEKKMVLKVLHPYLDEAEVASVVISNVCLDAANANRLIEVHRGLGSIGDLEVLARGCLGVNTPSASMAAIVRGLCTGYLNLQKVEVIREVQDPVTKEVSSQSVKRFPQFHFRDFIYLLRHLNRTKFDVGSELNTVTQDQLLQALEYNFGGLDQESFIVLADVFFNAVLTARLDADPDDDVEFCLPSEQLRKPLDVFCDSLKDADQFRDTAKDYSELHPRFKLIIDSSEDDSVARLLKEVDVDFDKVFRMSNFSDDNTELDYARLISDIKLCMEHGDRILMIDTQRIHGSFYDLFNQNYQVMTGDRGEQLLYSNVAVGAESHICRVDRKFQCVVHMRKQDLQNTPAPFLSRFEKYNLSIKDFFEAKASKLVRRDELDFVYARTQDFVQYLGAKYFLGFKGENTLASLFMAHMQPGDDGKLRFCPYSLWTRETKVQIRAAALKQPDYLQSQYASTQAMCARLLQLVPPEVATLKIQEGLGFDHWIYRNAYFKTQEHVEFQSLVLKLAKQGSQSLYDVDCINTCHKTVVMTRSSPDTTRFALSDDSDPMRGRLSSNQELLRNYFPDALTKRLDVANLEKYPSETLFRAKLDAFVADESKHVIVIVADATTTPVHHLNFIRHLIDQLSMSKPGSSNPTPAIFDPEPEPEPDSGYEYGEPQPEPENHAPELEPELDQSALVHHDRQKQFLLLLHFAPERILTGQDYPTVFLNGWDYMYIDSIATQEAFSAKTLTSLLLKPEEQLPEAADTGIVQKGDKMMDDALWHFCSQVKFQRRSDAPLSISEACRFYDRGSTAGEREKSIQAVLKNAGNARIILGTIREKFYRNFKPSSTATMLQRIARNLVSGDTLASLSDQCYNELRDQFFHTARHTFWRW